MHTAHLSVQYAWDDRTLSIYDANVVSLALHMIIVMEEWMPY